MNLPNALTLGRIGLACALILLLSVEGCWAKMLALTLFVLACGTDWLDGRLARRRRQITVFGTLMDPIADKVLVLGAFIAFVQLRLIPAWMVLIIIARELLITGVRLLATSGGRVLPALRLGKHKTFSQMFAILTILALLIVREAAPRWGSTAAAAVAAWSVHASYLVMLVAVCFTLISGIQFLWVHRELLRHGPDQ